MSSSVSSNDVHFQEINSPPVEASAPAPKKRRSKLVTNLLILVRRAHLYAGLFLLPWVFLYGITGAMFNHEGLLPESEFRSVPAEKLTESPLMKLPTPGQLAEAVIDQLQSDNPDHEFELHDDHGAEYNNNIIYKVQHQGQMHSVHINPVNKDAYIAIHPKETEALKNPLPDVKNVKLQDPPYSYAQNSVEDILTEAGIETDAQPQPLGWCKLNFVAHVDGSPSRITYVLRDGHIDASQYDGNDGMSTRAFFMRLHTTHGQPPHWNGRMYWTIILDVMAIAMVCWGATGLVMWWQIKRTRKIGAVIMLLSIGCAVFLYLSVMNFYATTKL
ncbi:MAG: PepSY domain-containing protein [Pirellulaceae bacterium]